MENTKNTKSAPLCNTKARCYSITINNYTDEDLKNLDVIKNSCKSYGWQSEIGKDGTPHLQGYLYFKNAKSFKVLKKILPRAHIEIARNYLALKNYVKKAETHDGKIRVETPTKTFLRAKTDPLSGKLLHNFQKKILKQLEEKPDDRSIFWYWEKHGNIGKTSLCKHLVMKYSDILLLSGKSSDMKYGVAKYVHDNDGPKAILIDLTRSRECYVSYEGIEEVKNGIFYNTKYESGMVTYDSPHVIIFANFEPDVTKLSLDRWKIYNIRDLDPKLFDSSDNSSVELSGGFDAELIS